MHRASGVKRSLDEVFNLGLGAVPDFNHHAALLFCGEKTVTEITFDLFNLFAGSSNNLRLSFRN